jgi:hypothetical protein
MGKAGFEGGKRENAMLGCTSAAAARLNSERAPSLTLPMRNSGFSNTNCNKFLIHIEMPFAQKSTKLWKWKCEIKRVPSPLGKSRSCKAAANRMHRPRG